MSDTTQAETELQRERDKAEEQCASWREILRLEREHAAARLTAMTARAEKAEQHFLLACTDNMDYLTCQPDCDSYGHSSQCAVAYPGLEFARLQQEIARLRTALEYYAQTAISATAVQALAGTEEGR